MSSLETAHVLGFRMAYVDVGRGSLVVLVHGSPVSSASFRHATRALAARHRVIAPDLLGFGDSEAPSDGADFRLQAEALAALLRELGVHEAALAVHDWGGPIGLAAAMQARVRLSGLVLTNTTCDPEFSPPAYWRPFVGRMLGRSTVVRWNLVRLAMPTMMRAWRQADVRRRYLAPLSRRETRETILALEQLRGYRGIVRDLPDWLRRIQAPTALVWGTPDPYFGPAAREWLERAFSRSSTILLPRAGHFPQEDAPLAYARELVHAFSESS